MATPDEYSARGPGDGVPDDPAHPAGGLRAPGEALEIEARALTAHGPQGLVFSGADLLVRPAGLTVIAGQGGTGRTSLLLALGGRFRTASGTVSARLGERAVPPLAHTSLARARPGLELFPQWTVGEHIAERRATTRSFATDTLHRAGALLDCAPPPKAVLGRLTARDRLLFALALALAERRPAVLVDDVDAGLGGSDLREVWLCLGRVAEAGVTVLATAAAPPPPEWAVPLSAYLTLPGRRAAADATRRP